MNNAGGVNTPPGTRQPDTKVECLKVREKGILDLLFFKLRHHRLLGSKALICYFR